MRLIDGGLLCAAAVAWLLREDEDKKDWETLPSRLMGMVVESHGTPVVHGPGVPDRLIVSGGFE